MWTIYRELDTHTITNKNSFKYISRSISAKSSGYMILGCFIKLFLQKSKIHQI